MSSTYLYAIMAGEHRLDLGAIGLPDGEAPVHTVVADGLSALVGDYDGPDLAALPREELLRFLIVHQQVLEQVGGEYTLLPATLGIVLASEDETRDALIHFRARLHSALDEVGNAVEIDLSATWDLDTILAEISRTPDLVEMVGAMGNQQPQEAITIRLQVGQLVQERVEARREEYRRRVVGELVRYVRDAQPNPRPTDQVVFNVAFLVERDGLVDFDAAVDRLGEELEGHLNMRYVGPLPPYSFGSVELTRPDPARVAAARELLGIGESVTKGELERAYRQTAARLHPDVNRDDPSAQEKFSALTAAHDDLKAYLSGYAGDAKDGETRYDLTEESVQGARLLQIRRGEPQLGEAMESPRESPVSP